MSDCIVKRKKKERHRSNKQAFMVITRFISNHQNNCPSPARYIYIYLYI